MYNLCESCIVSFINLLFIDFAIARAQMKNAVLAKQPCKRKNDVEVNEHVKIRKEGHTITKPPSTGNVATVAIRHIARQILLF
jgi:hypothetical protein